MIGDIETMIDHLERGSGRVGLDIGSRSTKMVNGKDMILSLCDTPEFLERAREINLSHELDIVTTGYGRYRISDSRSIPEIRAHATGVIRSTGMETGTILDIGGQDFKVIRVEGRSIRDFHMNDKCAAGTGRFLEKMAGMLSMTLDDLGRMKGDRRILESTCSVFTETEIISLMMEGVSTDELASGVIYSVYERIRPYLRMFPSDKLIFTGGVASMDGLRETISLGMGVDVMVPSNSQFTGAIGCFHSR